MEIKIHEGLLSAKGFKFGIVVSRFNSIITNRLIEGAVDALLRHGCEKNDIDIFKVPGSFEIPLVASKLTQTGKYNAIICLGAVIRGETPHFDFVATETTKGIAQVALKSGVPVTYGIITADTMEQAIDRAGGKAGNKGAEAAISAIEMVNLLNQIK